jgi:hypothetical protein
MNRLTKLIVFLAIAAGGCGGGSGNDGYSLWFAVHQGPKSLLVSVTNSYQFSVDPARASRYGSGVGSGGEPGMPKSGQLDESTVSALSGYFTNEKIRRYVEGAASYTEDCVQHGLAISWSGQGAWCWYPADVSDPATSEMLQYVGNLLESIANG